MTCALRRSPASAIIPTHDPEKRIPAFGHDAQQSHPARRRRVSTTSGDTDPQQRSGPAGSPVPARVTFNRRELDRILVLYGRMVAAGEWRDYAIDFLKDRAVFSIFRRASEIPLYRIVKDPQLARRQGAYSVVSATGQILRRGHELERVLLVIDRKLAVVN
jgi:hypothetical protein